MAEIFLKPCPFCGGPSGLECDDKSAHQSWSVGCHNPDVDCIATLMITTFSRKSEAADAWNKRVGREEALEAALRPFADGAKELPVDFPDVRLLIPEGHKHNPKKHNLLLCWVRDFRKALAVLKPLKQLSGKITSSSQGERR